MAPPEDTPASHARVSARAVGAALKAFGAQGLSADDLLEEAGLEPDELADPDEAIPYEQLLRLWIAALRESGDEYLGVHSAAQVQLGDYEIFGYLMRTSPTVGELLAALHRYQRLLADAIEIEPSLEGELVRIRYSVEGYRLPRPLAEYVVGVLVVLTRAALGENIAPREVCFKCQGPKG